MALLYAATTAVYLAAFAVASLGTLDIAVVTDPAVIIHLGDNSVSALKKV